MVSANARARCRVCSNPEAPQMQVAMLLQGVSIDTMHKRFPTISRDSFARCKKKHLGEIAVRMRAEELGRLESEKYRRALDELKDREGRSLLAHLVASRHRLNQLGAKADLKNDYREAAKIETRIVGVLEATGRLLGSFAADNARTIVNNNSLVISADYIKLRTNLVRCLAPYPAARAAVAAMLSELEASETTPAEPVKMITSAPIDEDIIDAVVIEPDKD
jgi:hypothetical protein